MSTPRVENTFLRDSAGADQPDKQEKLEIQNALNALPAEALHKAEFRIAIRASTARILNLALTCGDLDSDPEVA
jgi:DsbC/DsbD-like thiol-disulfide interchange protein